MKTPPADSPVTTPTYSRDYFEQYGAGKRSYSHVSAQDPSHVRILKEIQRLGWTQGSLLDIGCATGTFLHLAREAGFQARGVEVSAWAAQQAQQASGCEVFCLDMAREALPLPSGSTDVVTMNECIEHIPHPLHALQEVRRILRQGGLLFVHTPIVFHRWLQDPTHVIFFTAESLPWTLEHAGFRILRKGLEGGPLQRFRIPRLLRILTQGDVSQPLLFPYVPWGGRFMSCYGVKSE